MAAADHVASRLLDHLMNVNDVTGPWMPRIKDHTLFGPMGVASSRCTTAEDHTRALTARPPIKPTSRRCLSAWQPNPGRRSTYQCGDSVQTTGTTSCFALDLEDQRLSGFRYQYSNYQIEYGRNLIFEVGGQMEQVFQALIDRSRARLDLKTVKTILGYKRRPKYRSRKKRAAEWEVAVERPSYDLTIFKLHCGGLTLKIYSKGERVLRIEVIVHNTRQLHCQGCSTLITGSAWRGVI
jgi:hypothetical protein